ncbi:accessory gland-specific peptide 26Aa [Drosophila elegans]|uniref:accessory gland-specific peptide 26Aa n=1 Tax=Drosophila elegans TaxID=30023 RepID=UPI0007E65017|nr:accessory gland-specific peptide 26Aa [Drosophila elegans]
MRVLLLCPAFLILLANGDSVSQNVLNKSDSVQRDSSKGVSLMTDLSPLGDSPMNFHRSDSLPNVTPWGDYVAQSAPFKSDPPQNETSKPDKNDSLPSAIPFGYYVTQSSPLTETSKKDLLLIQNKGNLEGDSGKNVPSPGHFSPSATETVKALQQRLLEEQAKTLLLRNQSAYLLQEIQARKSQVLRAQELSLDMADKRNHVNRNLLEIHVQLENVRKQVKKCQGKLSGKEIFRLADIEANRLLKEEREPVVNYNNRNRFLKLLRELRRKIKDEINLVSELVADSTTTVRPTDGIFPTLPWP